MARICLKFGIGSAIDQPSVTYPGGLYAGAWDILEIQNVSATQTKVDWSIYSCYTVYISKFH